MKKSSFLSFSLLLSPKCVCLSVMVFHVLPSHRSMVLQFPSHFIKCIATEPSGTTRFRSTFYVSHSPTAKHPTQRVFTTQPPKMHLTIILFAFPPQKVPNRLEVDNLLDVHIMCTYIVLQFVGQEILVHVAN